MIVLFDDAPKDLKKEVLEIDSTAYMEYAPRAYVLNFGGTAKALWERLGYLREADRPAGIVVSISDYFGFAKKDLWSWLSNAK